jgi:transcriptional regulator with XRE-family HTH domain
MLHPITPGQCRAARALLDITQTELAARADCGLSTVVDFEKRRRDVSAAAVSAIQKALERSGIAFIREGRQGVGVKLSTPPEASGG